MDDIDRLLGEDEASESEIDPSAPLVVVIDDDATQRMSLRYALEKKYRVDVYSSGSAGVEHVKEDASCIILDIKILTHV